jgi:hypothetical protein
MRPSCEATRAGVDTIRLGQICSEQRELSGLPAAARGRPFDGADARRPAGVGPALVAALRS